MFEVVDRPLEEQASKLFVAQQITPAMTGVELPLYQFTDEQIAWMHESEFFRDPAKVTFCDGIAFSLEDVTSPTASLFIAKAIDDSRAAVRASLYDFSLPEYDRMIEAGVLTKYDKTELLQGTIIVKARKSIEHEYVLDYLSSLFYRMPRDECHARCQATLRLTSSETEPDFQFLRGPSQNYMRRHPEAADTSLVIEIADSYLDKDKLTKTYLYAQNHIPSYWIVNLIDHRMEMYELEDDPSAPNYRLREIKTGRDVVDVVAFGKIYGQIDLAELFAT